MSRRITQAKYAIEKLNIQVQIIGIIYKRASQVIAWFGQLGNPEIIAQLDIHSCGLAGLAQVAVPASFRHPSSLQKWKSLVRVCSENNLERVWRFQEFVLGLIY